MPHLSVRKRAIAFKQPDRPLPLLSLPPPSLTPFHQSVLLPSLLHIMASRAIPSHLKPSAAEEGGFAPRHHGKSQSHVVSTLFLCLCSCPACVLLFPALLACIGFVAARRTQLSSPLPVVSTWVWWGPRRAGIELATIAGRSQYAARRDIKAISYERTRQFIRVGVRCRSRVLAPHSHRLLPAGVMSW